MSKKSISKKYALEHQFITYRGFTYEYGSSYNAQSLDINDPDYKYKNGKDLNSRGITNLGSSYCTWEDVQIYISKPMWRKSEYLTFEHNCQDFTIGLGCYLTGSDSPCNQPPSRRKKRQAGDSSAYIDRLLANCSCCLLGSSSSAVPTLPANSAFLSSATSSLLVLLIMNCF